MLTRLARSWYIFLFYCPMLPEISFARGDMAWLTQLFLSPAGGGPIRAGAITPEVPHDELILLERIELLSAFRDEASYC